MPFKFPPKWNITQFNTFFSLMRKTNVTHPTLTFIHICIRGRWGVLNLLLAAQLRNTVQPGTLSLSAPYLISRSPGLVPFALKLTRNMTQSPRQLGIHTTINREIKSPWPWMGGPRVGLWESGGGVFAPGNVFAREGPSAGCLQTASVGWDRRIGERGSEVKCAGLWGEVSDYSGL